LCQIFIFLWFMWDLCYLLYFYEKIIKSNLKLLMFTSEINYLLQLIKVIENKILKWNVEMITITFFPFPLHSKHLKTSLTWCWIGKQYLI
jgi:hypothetical protein